MSNKDTILSDILSDANNGAQVIGKMLAISSLTSEDNQLCKEACRRVLPTIKASSTPPYRILLEAVGLPIPSGHMGGSSNGFSGGPRQGANAAWHNNQPTPPRGPQVPQNVAGPYGYYPYHQPNGSPALGGLTPGNLGAYGPMGQNLSPLLVAQNMPLGQTRNPSPKVGGDIGGMSPHTPVARHRGRMSPNSQMLSPGSDPFNPVSRASPSRFLECP